MPARNGICTHGLHMAAATEHGCLTNSCLSRTCRTWKSMKRVRASTPPTQQHTTRLTYCFKNTTTSSTAPVRANDKPAAKFVLLPQMPRRVASLASLKCVHSTQTVPRLPRARIFAIRALLRQKWKNGGSLRRATAMPSKTATLVREHLILSPVSEMQEHLPYGYMLYGYCLLPRLTMLMPLL